MPQLFIMVALLLNSSLLITPAFSEEPASSHLRIGTKKLPDGTEMVLLGTSNSNLSVQVSNHLDQLGFEIQGGQSTKDFDPQFLIVKNAEGIQQVFSLALAGSGMLKSSSALLDDKTVLKNALVSDISKVAQVSSGLFVSNPVKAVINAVAPFLMRKENRKEQQAKQFANLLADTLNSHDFVNQGIEGAKELHPDLLQVFSTGDLNRAYDDINRRYNKLYAGSLLSEDNRRSAISRQRMADQNDGQQIPVVAFANQEGYVRFPMNHFSMLAFDCASIAKNVRDDRGFDTGNIKTAFFADRCSKWPSSGPQYIPFAIYSTEQTPIAAQIIDFSEPSKLKNKRFLKAAESLASTALEGIAGSGYGVQIVDDIYKDRQLRHGSTLDLVDTKDAYSSLRMAAKDGGIHLNGEITDPNQAAKLDTTVFMSNLAKQKGMPAEQIADIQAGFASSDMGKWDQAFQNSVGFIAADQEGNVPLNLTTGAKRISKEANHINGNLAQLVTHLQEPAVLDSLDQQMNERNVAAQNPTLPPQKILTKKQLAKKAEAEQKFQQSLALAQSQGKCSPSSAVIEFQIDGLKPDSLARAADKGLIPTLKDRVLDHGVKFNSFVTNTVSTSSWTTIRSGDSEDQTVITGSSCFASRDPKSHDDNCLDYRGDYKLKSGYTDETQGGSRVYKAIKQTGNDVFPDSLGKDQILTDISPVHDGANLHPKSIAKAGADFGKDYIYGNEASSGTDLLDGGNTQAFIDQIKANPCQYHEVQLWLASVDEDSHYSPRALDRTYQHLDQNAKKLLDAMALDPVLKNARIIIDSDHGVSAGIQPSDPSREVLPDKTIFMKDTSRNYTHCFAGNCNGWEDFDFVIGSLNPDAPRHGGLISSLNRTVLKPFNFSYDGEPGHKNAGREGYKDHRTLLAESYGNEMQAFYFLCNGVKTGQSCANQDAAKRASYYDITHYKNDKGQELNTADRLLSDHVENTMVDDNPALKKALYEKTQNRPVAFLAMPLQGQIARASAAALAGVPVEGLRDPIVVRAYKNKASIILTKDTPKGPVYRYLVVENFDQDKNSKILGKVIQCAREIKTCTEQDPLGYKENTSSGTNGNDWQDKHALLSRLQNTEYPTAIFALSRNLTLDPKIANNRQYQARIPDLLAYSNEGFDFNPYQNNLGNHGALRREIAHNTLYISGCKTAAQASEPVLGEQIGQTVKSWMGDSNPGSDNLNSQFDEACTAAETPAATTQIVKTPIDSSVPSAEQSGTPKASKAN